MGKTLAQVPRWSGKFQCICHCTKILMQYIHWCIRHNGWCFPVRQSAVAKSLMVWCHAWCIVKHKPWNMWVLILVKPSQWSVWMKKFGHGEHVTNRVWTETGSEELDCRPILGLRQKFMLKYATSRGYSSYYRPSPKGFAMSLRLPTLLALQVYKLVTILHSKGHFNCLHQDLWWGLGM